MNKYIKLAIAAVAGASLVTSCDLNLVPTHAISYDESSVLIQTKANLSALENGLFDSFRRAQNGNFVEATEFQFDGFNATVDYGNNYGAMHKSDYNLTSGDYDVEDTWAYNYFSIKNDNIFIAAADKVEDESLKAGVAIVKGEAHFLRAMSYMTLARHFGKAYSANSASTDLCVPLVLVYDQAAQPARATVAEVYDQIKKDLDEAASLLAGVKGAVRAKKPTIDAINAMYARYYLDIADYANAAIYAHKVIDSKTYKLASTAAEMEAEYVKDEGTEPIFQLAMALSEFSYVSDDDKSDAQVMNSWTLALSNNTYDQVLRPYFIPTQTLVDSYDQGDLRFSAWFDGETVVNLAGNFFNVDKTDFYTFVKFFGNPAFATTPIRNGRTAPKLIKISEMYLIAAEAELSSDPAAAKKDLNALQAARGAVQTEATVETVRKEWFRETVGEGQRKFCLKRWGIGFEGRAMQPGAVNVLQQGAVFDGKNFEANSNYFQYPIPSHEIKLNKNLVQNPGYDSL